jgi:hypothetical protein
MKLGDTMKNDTILAIIAIICIIGFVIFSFVLTYLEIPINISILISLGACFTTFVFVSVLTIIIER